MHGAAYHAALLPPRWAGDSGSAPRRPPFGRGITIRGTRAVRVAACGGPAGRATATERGTVESLYVCAFSLRRADARATALEAGAVSTSASLSSSSDSPTV